MKKIFLPFHEIKHDRGFWLWLIIHLGIPVLFLLSLFIIGPIHINTMLMDMLPQSTHLKEITLADSVLGERTGREALILASAPDFETAKKGAAFLYEEFTNSPKSSQLIEEITLYFDSSIINQFTDFLFDYRFVIAEKETLDLLNTGRAQEIAYDALAAAYSAFTFFSLDNIDKDPFLLAGRRMESFLTSSLLSGGSGLQLREDVLAAHIYDAWHVLLRITLAPQGVSLSEGSNIIGEFYTAAAAAKQAEPDLEFYFSGVPFHSFESSSSAQREISFIGTLTIIIIIILFLFIFRSPLPIIFSIMDVLISLGMAAAAVFLIFREVHIITFVFGTTLIGTCVDYSVHFFVHWKSNTALKTGMEIRSLISKSIVMSFISTIICYITFLFAPFLILKQFAVFSLIGLLSSFLTAYCLYPLIAVPDNEKREINFFKSRLFLYLNKFSLPPFFRYALIACFIIIPIFIFATRGIKIDNDIRSLYTMSEFMLESEMRTAQVLDHGSPSWYFIVSGNDMNETLENEERLIMRLEQEVTKGNLKSFLGTTVFIPSIKKQQETYEAMRTLLPLAQSQYEYLGFPPEYSEIFIEEYAIGNRICLPDHAPAQVGISNLWIGKAGEQYFSCVLPFHPKDEALFRAIAEEFDFVFFINKTSDISRDLDTLSRTIILFFLAAFLVISIVVFVVYPKKDAIKICAVPIIIALTALTALTLNNIPLGFFSIAAILLVFGLGLDYIFYITGGRHSGNRVLPSFAIILSFLTTLLSFGALGFSSFAPVHVFGFTVSIGLCAAFISTMLLMGKTDSENH